MLSIEGELPILLLQNTYLNGKHCFPLIMYVFCSSNTGKKGLRKLMGKQKGLYWVSRFLSYTLKKMLRYACCV